MNYKDINKEIGNVDIYLLDQILKGRFEEQRKVLDAGCGEGRNLTYFVKNDFDVYGVDTNQMAIKMAQMTYPKIKDNLKVGMIGNLEYDDEFFNVIICAAVLHFANDKEHFMLMLESLVRVLRPTGLLFIRMATDIGLNQKPSGEEFSFLLTQDILDELPGRFNLKWVEPFKTVLVNGERSMATMILEKGL